MSRRLATTRPGKGQVSLTNLISEKVSYTNLLWLCDFFFSCCCGRLETDHQPQANNPTKDVKWEVDKHTKPDGPTDAYGELEFTGAGPSSRAKVSTVGIYRILTTGRSFLILFIPACKLEFNR